MSIIDQSPWDTGLVALEDLKNYCIAIKEGQGLRNFVNGKDFNSELFFVKQIFPIGHIGNTIYRGNFVRASAIRVNLEFIKKNYEQFEIDQKKGELKMNKKELRIKHRKILVEEIENLKSHLRVATDELRKLDSSHGIKSGDIVRVLIDDKKQTGRFLNQVFEVSCLHDHKQGITLYVPAIVRMGDKIVVIKEKGSIMFHIDDVELVVCPQCNKKECECPHCKKCDTNLMQYNECYCK